MENNNGLPRKQAEELGDVFEELNKDEAAGAVGGTVSEFPMDDGVKRYTPEGVRPKNKKEVMESLKIKAVPVKSYSIDVSKLKTLKDMREFIASLDIIFHNPADAMLKFLKEK